MIRGFPIGAAVLGGTASQLMKLVGSCEYLFVDEAGQVTLELLAVLARKAQNLLLVLRQKRTAKVKRGTVKTVIYLYSICRWSF